MCIACKEFIKGTLTMNEFKSALREITRSGESGADEAHLREVQTTLQGTGTENLDQAKELLSELLSPKSA